jgi:hypothetical protein
LDLVLGRTVNQFSAELDTTAGQVPFSDGTLDGAAIQNGAAAHGSGQPAIGYLDFCDLRII